MEEASGLYRRGYILLFVTSLCSTDGCMHVCLFVDGSGVIWDKRKIIRSLAGQPEKRLNSAGFCFFYFSS